MALDFPRVRDELIVRRRSTPAGLIYIVYDPRTNGYQELDEVQGYIFKLLDGSRSMERVIATAATALGADIGPEDMLAFIDTLRAKDLLDVAFDTAVDGAANADLARRVLAQFESDAVVFRKQSDAGAGGAAREQSVDAGMIDAAIAALEAGDARRAALFARALLARSPDNKRARYLHHTLLSARFRRATARGSLLSTRFTLMNPDRVLFRLVSALRPLLLSKLPIALWLGFVVASIALLSGEVDLIATIAADTLRVDRLFSAEVLLVVFVSARVEMLGHELMHALMCRLFGGRVTNIGVAVVYFIPTAYCDTSSTYLLPERWQRILVPAIGPIWDITWMFFFLDLCVLVHDGSSATPIFLILAMTCLFQAYGNLNPFVKNDAYLAIIEWLGYPSLMEDSAALVKFYVERFFLGHKEPVPDELATRKVMFVVYAACSFFFVSSLTIFGLIFTGYAWVTQMGVVGLTLYFMLIAYILNATVKDQLRWLATRGPVFWRAPRVRIALVASVLVVVLAGVYPSELAATVTGTVKPRSTVVHATVGGIVEQVEVEQGARVEVGQPLLRVRNARLDPQLRSAESDVARLHNDLAVLAMPTTVEERALTVVTLNGVQRRLSASRSELARFAEAERVGLGQGAQVAQRRRDVAQLETQRSSLDARRVADAQTGDEASIVALQAQIDAAQATVKLLREVIDNRVLTAPVAGAVSFVGASRGASLIGRPLAAGDAVMVIREDAPLSVELLVPEDAAEQWTQVGQPARVRITGFPSERFDGVITDMSVAAGEEALGGRKGRKLTVTLSATRADVPAGAEVRVELHGGRRANALQLRAWLKRTVEADILRLLANAPS